MNNYIVPTNPNIIVTPEGFYSSSKEIREGKDSDKSGALKVGKKDN